MLEILKNWLQLTSFTVCKQYIENNNNKYFSYEKNSVLRQFYVSFRIF